MTEEDMARLCASEVACYRWPMDTAEHRAMRAAFCDGAALTARQDGVREELGEHVNVLSDMLGDVLGYLEGDISGPAQKAGLISEIKAYFDARQRREPMLVRRLEQGVNK